MKIPNPESRPWMFASRRLAAAGLGLVLAQPLAIAADHNTLTPAEKAAGWMLLFDGSSLDGWRASEQPGAYRIENGELVALGPRAHLFYLGSVADHEFKNFELRLDVKTYPGANSGVYFHTRWQQTGWPTQGYEVQVNNSFAPDPRRTGSLYAIRDNNVAPVADGEWFTLRIQVDGKRITTWVNDKVIIAYTQEANPQRPPDMADRLLSSGTFALQAHHAGNEVHYRDIKVRLLP